MKTVASLVAAALIRAYKASVNADQGPVKITYSTTRSGLKGSSSGAADREGFHHFFTAGDLSYSPKTSLSVGCGMIHSSSCRRSRPAAIAKLRGAISSLA